MTAPGATAIEPRVWEFCMAYNLFRIACIRQGILKRGCWRALPRAAMRARRDAAMARATAGSPGRQVEEHFGG